MAGKLKRLGKMDFGMRFSVCGERARKEAPQRKRLGIIVLSAALACGGLFEKTERCRNFEQIVSGSCFTPRTGGDAPARSEMQNSDGTHLIFACSTLV